MRKLGSDGPEITLVGVGAWAMGGPGPFGWGEVDDDESVQAIHHALDRGVNWIDTAAVYGFGHSEEVVGKAIGSRPPATTCSSSASAGAAGTTAPKA